MIAPSTSYAITENGIVVFKGSKREARQIRKSLKSISPGNDVKLWLSLDSKIGDKLQ